MLIRERYQLVLDWRRAGVSFAQIGTRLGLSTPRAYQLYRDAQLWALKMNYGNPCYQDWTPGTQAVELDFERDREHA